MPDDMRKLVEKAMGSQTRLGRETNLTTMRTNIVFNGTEYDSTDAMPRDVRQLYEKVLKAAETGTAPSEIDVAGIKGGVLMKPKTFGITLPNDSRNPTKMEPSFSRGALIVSVVLTALILLLYYLVQSR